MSNKILRGLQSLVGVFVICSFVPMGYWWEYYTRHLPRTPVPQDGRVIPLHLNHDIVVYATALERQKLQDTWHLACVGLGVMLLVLSLDFFIKVKNRKISN